MTDLIAFKGIHRKTASLILLAANIELEGILDDLHVLRVVNRMGITSGSKNATIVEKVQMLQF